LRYASAKRAGHKIVAVFKETASGVENGRPQRGKVLALARAHEIDAILVTELSRWGRSTQDLVLTLDDFAWLESERPGSDGPQLRYQHRER
jgi:putative DNA-invertase from lambdoid prophage Rac